MQISKRRSAAAGSSEQTRRFGNQNERGRRGVREQPLSSGLRLNKRRWWSGGGPERLGESDREGNSKLFYLHGRVIGIEPFPCPSPRDSVCERTTQTGLMQLRGVEEGGGWHQRHGVFRSEQSETGCVRREFLETKLVISLLSNSPIDPAEENVQHVVQTVSFLFPFLFF